MYNMSTRLFVGNLPDTISEHEIKEAFSQYGQIVNVDLKTKPGSENDKKRFAFVTLSASNYEVETCIRHFSNEDLCGNRLYVTRARESFLERLQRERHESQKRESEKDQHKELPKENPVLKLSEKLNPRTRKIELTNDIKSRPQKTEKPFENNNKRYHNFQHADRDEIEQPRKLKKDRKQQDSDLKRMESIKRKRQEFKEKQMIIKSGLIGIDKVQNKKVIFTDNDDNDNITVSNISNTKIQENNKKNDLFDGDDSDYDVNFEIKKQFEGKKGQKVLDLQSKFKSDKRFVLDERFIEDGQSEEEKEQTNANYEAIDLGDIDEKTKQLNILQDVLGVSIKTHSMKNDNQKTRAKLGMLRFDPMQPDHVKFLAPVEETKQEPVKKSKKGKTKLKSQEKPVDSAAIEEQPKIEVSKEQFYKISDTLKEALEQPAMFSLRSLFDQNDNNEKDPAEQQENYIPVVKTKESKVKNPLEPTAKNPFVYDSSDSEDEAEGENKEDKKEISNEIEPKAVWKEKLFFSDLDNRLQDGLAFFTKPSETKVQKERRELKTVMKKRIYNKERKNQMFQKKIGGRKKSLKKSYRKKS